MRLEVPFVSRRRAKSILTEVLSDLTRIVPECSGGRFDIFWPASTGRVPSLRSTRLHHTPVDSPRTLRRCEVSPQDPDTEPLQLAPPARSIGCQYVDSNGASFP